MDRSIGGELLWRKSLRGSKLLAGALHARPAINPSNSMEVSSPILSRPGTAPRGHGHSLRSAGWSWRLELEWCERKIMLDWLELELVAEVM
jgi:hypothetical protein